MEHLGHPSDVKSPQIPARWALRLLTRLRQAVSSRSQAARPKLPVVSLKAPGRPGDLGYKSARPWCHAFFFLDSATSTAPDCTWDGCLCCTQHLDAEAKCSASGLRFRCASAPRLRVCCCRWSFHPDGAEPSAPPQRQRHRFLDIAVALHALPKRAASCARPTAWTPPVLPLLPDADVVGGRPASISDLTCRTRPRNFRSAGWALLCCPTARGAAHHAAGCPGRLNALNAWLTASDVCLLHRPWCRSSACGTDRSPPTTGGAPPAPGGASTKVKAASRATRWPRPCMPLAKTMPL